MGLRSADEYLGVASQALPAMKSDGYVLTWKQARAAVLEAQREAIEAAADVADGLRGSVEMLPRNDKPVLANWQGWQRVAEGAADIRDGILALLPQSNTIEEEVKR